MCKKTTSAVNVHFLSVDVWDQVFVGSFFDAKNVKIKIKLPTDLFSAKERNTVKPTLIF